MTETDIDTNNKFQDKNQEKLLEVVEKMYKAGVHLGYSRTSSHPKMKSFFYTLKNNVQIFNLEKVHLCLEKAGNFLNDLGAKKELILFVATKPESKNIVKKIAVELELPYVTERWIGGTLTNFDVIKKRAGFLKNLIEQKESGEFSLLSKKEAGRMDKLIVKLEKQLSGLKNLPKLPSALVVVDSKEEKTAVTEANKIGIPIVALLNSDCDPTLIKYPIPANDASVTSIEYILNNLAVAYREGMKKESKKDEKKLITNENKKVEKK